MNPILPFCRCPLPGLTIEPDAEEAWEAVEVTFSGFRPLYQVQLSAALPLLPLMVQWVLDLAAAFGPGFLGLQLQLQEAVLGSRARLAVECQVALNHLAAFLWCLGEELEAGAEGAPCGSRKCPDDRGLVDDARAAGRAAQRSVVWPPRSPAGLAGAAEAALLLLSHWHGLRAVLVPEAFATLAAKGAFGVTSLRLQRRLPTACGQLVAAAGAALDGSRSGKQILQALPAALNTAATACKLVRLAGCDAAHWTLLGAAAAANASFLPGSPTPCLPYQPISLVLAAAGAAERSTRRLLLAPRVLQEPDAAFLRR